MTKGNRNDKERPRIIDDVVGRDRSMLGIGNQNDPKLSDGQCAIEAAIGQLHVALSPLTDQRNVAGLIQSAINHLNWLSANPEALSVCADGGKDSSDARDTEREYERIAATAIADSWTNQDIFEEGYRAALSVCADGGKDSSDAEPVAYLSTEPRNWDGSRIKPQGTFTIPVYARPQPRYLTDEEIEEISHQRETWSVVEFGRALIDAAIKKEEK
jgi:hypothetical protein